MISIEALVTSPQGFGIVTASPAQRAVCRILDGRPLDDLREHPDVLALVGGAAAIAALPSERGKAATENAFIAAIRSLKTIIALAASIKASQVVDTRGLTHGEIPRVTILSLKLDIADAAYAMLRATVQASPILRHLLVGEPGANSLMLRHPSGRPVEIACVAGSKAGAGLIARWSAGLIADEAPRMCGSEDGVVNLDDARSAVLGRLLPMALALYIGSPWGCFGPIYDLVREHWAQPNDQIVVLRGTGPMLNPTWWTPERCEDLRKRNPPSYLSDVLGDFLDAESALLTSDLLAVNTRDAPAELSPDPDCYYVAAMDPAARGNAWTLTIAVCVSVDAEVKKKYAIALCRQWVGSSDAPLSPERVLREIAIICRRYRVTTIRTDQWSGDALVDIARRVDLRLVIETITAARKLDIFENLKIMLEEHQLELPPLPLVRADLMNVQKRITQTGIAIALARTADGRHADYASSIALVMSANLPPREGWYERRVRAEGEKRFAVSLGSAGNFTGIN